MQSKSLSKLVKTIFSDEETKQQFISDPSSVMSQFKLTEQEKRAVLSTHARMALAGAGSAPGVSLAEPLAVWM
jgi:hypothetical protein